MKKQNRNLIRILFTVLTLIMIMLFPDEIKKGTYNGLILCCKNIIPSLFPISVVMLILIKLDISQYLKIFENIIGKVFKLNCHEFTVFIFSLFGGYPTGAKMLNQITTDSKNSKNNSEELINVCVNPGIGFTVSVIGAGLLHSKKAGYYLLLSGIISSFIILLILRNKFKMNSDITDLKPCKLSDALVSSVTESAKMMLNISSFIILFSAFNSLLLIIPKLKYLAVITEVTNGVILTDNIYIISFLVGFSGISIWCQIFSLTDNFKINLLKFAFFRILHGLLTSIILFILQKISPIELNVFNNSVSFTHEYLYSDMALTLALSIMTVMLIISVSDKIKCRNILRDVI